MIAIAPPQPTIGNAPASKSANEIIYCRCRQIGPSAGILLTQSKAPPTVAYIGAALVWGGPVKIGSLGQQPIGANSK